MLKNENILEEFKKSLVATTKSISKNNQVEINFTKENWFNPPFIYYYKTTPCFDIANNNVVVWTYFLPCPILETPFFEYIIYLNAVLFNAVSSSHIKYF